jgi:hypothetical protein
MEAKSRKEQTKMGATEEWKEPGAAITNPAPPTDTLEQSGRLSQSFKESGSGTIFWK